ncbi:tellurite resistance TerB family protein [Enterovibrio calviensis]|uniref:tellurite resistance TerB family protein n=1 Tax=Enterovibrio calviensis TaxID=91359 RepID=UPI0004813276|nr:TerB family tellurite resistance protein [Enterovibrio calviensis]
MNIIAVFQNKVASLLTDSQQSANEKLIELATFFYKIDNRVSLAEQKYMDELLQTIEWKSTVSVESYQRNCISKIGSVIDGSDEDVSSYLSQLMQELSELGAAEKAVTLATEISDADGEIADDEVRYLDLIKSFK